MMAKIIIIFSERLRDDLAANLAKLQVVFLSVQIISRAFFRHISKHFLEPFCLLTGKEIESQSLKKKLNKIVSGNSWICRDFRVMCQ